MDAVGIETQTWAFGELFEVASSVPDPLTTSRIRAEFRRSIAVLLIFRSESHAAYNARAL